MSKNQMAVMPSSLAKALIEHGVRHYGVGGSVDGPIGGFGGQVLGFNQYHAERPDMTTQANLVPYIQQQQTDQANTFNQQADLATQLLMQSRGQGGPNPAMDQLNQTTAANVANQAALAASQRGAGANAGLMARQAARVGAGLQQQAIGQAATLRSNQMLGAQNQLQAQQQAMAQQALQGQSIGQGALAAQNTAEVQAQLGASQINANTSAQNAKQAGNITGGLLGGATGGLLSFSQGGYIPKMAGGGVMGMENYATPGVQLPGIIPYQQMASTNFGFKPGKKNDKGEAFNPAHDQVINDTGSQAKPGMALTNTPYAPPIQQQSYEQAMPGAQMPVYDQRIPLAQGGNVPFSQALVQGGSVPGQAKVSGNSEDNDVVPAMLSPGEIVLPRSVTQGGDVEGKAVAFLRHLRGAKGRGFGAVLKARGG